MKGSASDVDKTSQVSDPKIASAGPVQGNGTHSGSFADVSKSSEILCPLYDVGDLANRYKVTKYSIYRRVRNGCLPPPDVILPGLMPRKYWRISLIAAWENRKENICGE